MREEKIPVTRSVHRGLRITRQSRTSNEEAPRRMYSKHIHTLIAFRKTNTIMAVHDIIQTREHLPLHLFCDCQWSLRSSYVRMNKAQ